MIQPYIAVYKARCPSLNGAPSIFLNVVVKDTRLAPKSKGLTVGPDYVKRWRRCACVGFFSDN